MRNILKFLFGTICYTMMCYNYGYSIDKTSDEKFVKRIEKELHGNINGTVLILQKEIDRYEKITGKKLISYDNEEISDNISKDGTNNPSEKANKNRLS